MIISDRVAGRWTLKHKMEVELVSGRLQSEAMYMRMSTTVLQQINGLYWVELLKICQLWLVYSPDQINIVYSITYNINMSKVPYF